MINATSAFKTALSNDKRNYLLYADITLKTGTTLSITNADLWENGFSVNDAVSSDNNFDIGAAIINGGKLVLNNIYGLTESSGKFSSYDFTDARVVLWVGLNLNGTVERIRKGTYVVDEAKYNGSLITLSLLDYMSKFDRPYSESTLSYPATLGEIVREACTHCNVTLNTQYFPHYSHTIGSKPTAEALTYREIISYVAQIAGCFARCNVYGYLELKWFPTSFTGSGAHRIVSTFSHNLGVDDVVITGVSVSERITVTETSTGTNNNTVSTTKEVTQPYTSGTTGYMLVIDGNPLVQDGNGQTIANWLGNQFVGFRFRHGEISHLSDPTMEAGDVGRMIDPRGTAYNILISSTSFTAGNAQTTRSSAQTPERASAQRYTAAAKAYAQFAEKLHKEKKSRELALEDLTNRLAESPGLYTTVEVQQDNSKIYYLHDKPTLAESSIVWKMTADAWGVTTNYNGANTVWNAGLTVDGNLIANILNANGVNCDWLHGGTITLGGVNNGNGKLELYNAAGTKIGSMDNTGLVASGDLEIKKGTKYAKFQNVNVKYQEYDSTAIVDYSPTAFVVSDENTSELSAIVPPGRYAGTLHWQSSSGGGDTMGVPYTFTGIREYHRVTYDDDTSAPRISGEPQKYGKITEVVETEGTSGVKHDHYKAHGRIYNHMVRRHATYGSDAGSLSNAQFSIGFSDNGYPYIELSVLDLNNSASTSHIRLSQGAVVITCPSVIINGVDITPQSSS